MITLTSIPRDIVPLLPGGEVPVVLRPISEADQYIYFAESYIHGFIVGESLIDARKSAQSEHGPTDMCSMRSRVSYYFSPCRFNFTFALVNFFNFDKGDLFVRTFLWISTGTD